MKNDGRVTVRVPKVVLREFKKLKKLDDRSLNYLYVQALKDYVESRTASK